MTIIKPGVVTIAVEDVSIEGFEVRAASADEGVRLVFDWVRQRLNEIEAKAARIGFENVMVPGLFEPVSGQIDGPDDESEPEPT